LIDAFRQSSSDSACVGVALGRKSFWVLRTKGQNEKLQIEKIERYPMRLNLFSGSPSSEVANELASALSIAFENTKDFYTTLQVALPDPAVRFEVMELEKVPARGKSLNEFLNWRFNQGNEGTSHPLSFSGQMLGVEQNKNLFLGMAVDQGWLEVVQTAFQKAGLKASVIDMALAQRFNFFYKFFKESQKSGALITFEPEFWSVGLWDDQTRLRFVRSKWWDKEILKVNDLPLEATILEVERIIRAYVYSAKNRSVENLFVSASENWLKPIEEFLKKRTHGNCRALSLAEITNENPEVKKSGVVPSALAVAVQR